MRGKFITVEGLDGSGKTTIISQIIKYLNDHGITKIITTHEPGGTPISDMLRVLIKNGLGNEYINDISELLLIYAARSQLLENVIKPALLKGYWVVGDRYDLSSQAYQGGGRGVNIFLLRVLSNTIVKGFFPDLTFYLDISPEISMLRIKNRGITMDRIERESLNFFKRVRIFYKKLVNIKKNIILVDAHQNLKVVKTIVCQHLGQWLLSFEAK